MNLKSLQETLIKKKGTTEEIPFGPEALVYKVMGKMFALVAWEENPLRISLKCDPDFALALRAKYPAIIPGYHMNKRHWNSIILDGSLPETLILEMIDDSYTLVVKKLRKVDKEKLQQQ